jgi:hypothetical protein
LIGPGWLPSRPRPISRVRRGLLSYKFRRRRQRGAPPRAAALRLNDMTADGTPLCCNNVGMLFDGLPAELPTATLVPTAVHDRHRAIGGRIRQWFDDRWTWIRPRTVPLIAAFAGMIAVLGTTKYLSTYACAPQRGAVTYSVVTYDDAPPPHAIKARTGGPGRLRIEPVRPGSTDVTITLDP